MMKPAKHSLHALAVFALACLILSSATSQEKPDNPPVKFTARTELVLVPTVVTDKSGNHITGLKKEDFTLLENGSARTIATFDEIHTAPQPLLRPANNAEYSNFVSGSPSTSRITLIVLDLINTPFMAQASGRQELLKYLLQSLDTREPTALYTLNRSGIQVIHDFTTDPRILLAALHKVKGDTTEMVDTPETVEAITGTAAPDGSAGDPSTAGTTTAQRGNTSLGVQSEAANLQKMIEDSELNFQSFQQRLAITYTLDGMQQIAQALAGYPGRKSLIWAGGGFPFSVSDNTMQLAPIGRDSLTDVMPLYERTWQLLNNAQISLYPVDVKGLQNVSMPSAAIRNPGKNYGQRATWRQMDTQATLETFASMTGGRAYYNSNDLAKGFRDAVNDSSQYYMLGYYLDHSDSKIGWRKLNVRVNRSHTEVRARNGFFVTAADSSSNGKSDIASALFSPLDSTAIAMSARWAKIEPAKDVNQKHVTYELHLAPEADLINAADNNHLVLDVVSLTFTPEGKRAGQAAGQRIDVHLTPERSAKIQKDGVIFQEALDLAPGEYRVRFVVRDDFTGRVGSVAAPLKLQ